MPGVAVLVDRQMEPNAPPGAQENGKSAGAGSGNPGGRKNLFPPGPSATIHGNASV